MISQERRLHFSQHPAEADLEKQYRNYSHPHRAQKSVKANFSMAEASRQLRAGLNLYKNIKDGCSNEWCEAVSDEEYGKLK